MSNQFLDSEGIGNLLVKLGVALGALINPNTEISKQIKALDTNNDGIITKAEISNDYKSIGYISAFVMMPQQPNAFSRPSEFRLEFLVKFYHTLGCLRQHSLKRFGEVTHLDNFYICI